MKKRNLAIGLVALMVGGMTLTSCDPVSKKPGAILTINNGNENAKQIDIDKIFDRYITKSNGITSYYNAICEVVIRASIPVTEEIKNSAERSVNQQKDKAKSNAETNGTKYSDELDAILESNGVENLSELKDKFIYEQLKTKARENYFAENDNETAEESERYKLLKDYINTKVPYHISHMLINVSASDSDAGYKGQITEQEARNLIAAIKRLARGDSFGSVAQSLSGDTSSAQNFGEGDIVTLDTSYVNEFKLGVYAFDRIYNANKENAYEGKDKRVSRIGMSDKAEGYYADHAEIDQIPYKQVMEMDSLVDVTDSYGLKVNDDDPNFYPRNIYFNHLFNSRRIALITATAEEAQNLPGFVAPSEENGLKGLVADDTYVLCTTTGKPILAVRSGSGDSYQGIFFIVIEKSGLTEDSVELANYYDYKHNADWYNDKDRIGTTYVGFNEKENVEYNKRKEKIKTAVESYDRLLDTSIFEYYFGEDNFTYNNEIKFGDLTLEEAINMYIHNTRAYYEYTDKSAMEKTWTEFIEKLEYIESNEARRKPLVCAVKYKEARDADEYKKGGECYVEKIQ
ncbi:MAG: hypothetical protein J1F31_00330 [Erysipelotrichales bacterium]|nr:hypothetical protein [Erysipelotrichales bacterium]